MATANKSAAEKPAPTLNMTGKAGEVMPDFDKWTDLQIGFAPYWHPKAGEWIYAELIAIDARDPQFIRFQFKSLKTMECRRGPANEDESAGAVGEVVTVNPGETFSVSVYYSLMDEFRFHNYYRNKTGQPVPIRVDALKKVKTASKEGRMVWNFRVRTTDEIRAALEPFRDDYRALMAGDDTERPQLDNAKAAS